MSDMFGSFSDMMSDIFGNILSTIHHFFSPMITELVNEGIAQGLCRTDYPAEVVEMTLLYSCTVFDELSGYGEDERQKKAMAFVYNLERMLGMEGGSLQEAILPALQNTGAAR